MISFVDSFITDIYKTSIIEWLAVVSGTIYLGLLTRKNILCWYFALASSLLYVYLCFIAHLYLETLLQLFYAFMAVVGWYIWFTEKTEGQLQKSTEIKDKPINTKPIKIELPIREWSLKFHLFNILLSALISLVLGYIFANYTKQLNPYVDAFTTVFSLSTTYMVAKRILSNWIYWIVIDFVSIFLYYDRGYSLSSLLYLIYTIMAFSGFIYWQKQFKSQKTKC